MCPKDRSRLPTIQANNPYPLSQNAGYDMIDEYAE